jgi:hypothetical protein
MSTIVWSWAGVWLVSCLWLEWQLDRAWLPGTQDIREDYTRWSKPPVHALTPGGERLWRLRFRVTGERFRGLAGARGNLASGLTRLLSVRLLHGSLGGLAPEAEEIGEPLETAQPEVTLGQVGGALQHPDELTSA